MICVQRSRSTGAIHTQRKLKLPIWMEVGEEPFTEGQQMKIHLELPYTDLTSTGQTGTQKEFQGFEETALDLKTFFRTSSEVPMI